ncbi:MAG: hypothetical protein R3B84_17075 [Zavarzinella sp.]
MSEILMSFRLLVRHWHPKTPVRMTEIARTETDRDQQNDQTNFQIKSKCQHRS